ncbi:MAG: helical backbone metal receptor [Candidatus Pristimantibacillus sp.]
MKKVGWKLGIITLLIATTTACGNNNNQASTMNTAAAPSSTETPTATNEPTATEAQVAATTVVDENKVAEILAQFNNETPAKTITLSVAITELYNELGLELVGVPTSTSKLPEAYDQVTRVGNSHQPDLEQMVKLQPDVVLGPSSIKDSLEKNLTTTSLHTAYLPVDSLEELKLTTVALGRLYKQEEKAEALLQKFTEQENEALKLAEGKTAPKVLFLFGSAESLMFMNENTFAGSLAQKLGASNVVSDVLKLTETYIPLNMENIVEANPDVILLVAHGDPAAVAAKFEEDVKKNGAWEKLNAFKNGKMKTLDYSLFGTASLVKAPDAYKELAQILYN